MYRRSRVFGTDIFASLAAGSRRRLNVCPPDMLGLVDVFVGATGLQIPCAVLRAFLCADLAPVLAGDGGGGGGGGGIGSSVVS